MLKLQQLSETDCATHFELLSTRFDDALTDMRTKNIPLAPYATALFDFFRTQLTNILVGKPDQLISVINHVKSAFPAFHAQAGKRRLKIPPPSQLADANTVKAVEACFDYEQFAKKDVIWSAYSLVGAIGARICPYCHLHHVNYHLPLTKKAFAFRPPLDHFLPRAIYPYLAVSLGNLIPCCSQCNSSIKLAIDPLKLGLLSPLDANSRLRVFFSAVGSIPVKAGGKSETVKLSVNANTPESVEHILAFKLTERYQWYKHEVLDLMKNFDRFADLPNNIRRVVLQDDYVLGFDASSAEERAFGLCLLDVYNELKSNIVA